MSTKSTFSDFFSENKSLLKEYAETRLELIKLQGIRVVSRGFSLMLFLSIVLFLGFLITLFLGLAFAWWLSSVVGSQGLGFALTALVYGILFLLVILFRKPLFRGSIIRLFISEVMYEMDETEEE